MELIINWLPYYILGLVGILLHIVSKLEKGDSIPSWIKNNVKEFWFSFIGYHVLIFFWIDTGFEFFGMLKGVPSGQSFMIGWFGNSLLSNLVGQFAKKLERQNTGGTQ